MYQKANAKDGSTIIQAGTVVLPPAVTCSAVKVGNWQIIDSNFINKQKSIDTDLRRFLEQGTCKWSYIISERLVERSAIPEIINLITHEGRDFVGLLADGRDGKSTILMQLAYKLYQKGKTVAYDNGRGKDREYSEIPESLPKGSILIFDNVSATDEFQNMLDGSRIYGYQVIFASRRDEWANDREELPDDLFTRDVAYVTMSRLDENEQKSFAKLLFGLYPEKTTLKNAIKVFNTYNDHSLWQPIDLIITETANPEKATMSIVAKMNYAHKDLVTYVVFAERIHAKLPYRLLENICKYARIDLDEFLSIAGITVQVNRGIIETRNHDISSNIYEGLFSESKNDTKKYTFKSKVARKIFKKLMSFHDVHSRSYNIYNQLFLVQLLRYLFNKCYLNRPERVLQDLQDVHLMRNNPDRPLLITQSVHLMQDIANMLAHEEMYEQARVLYSYYFEIKRNTHWQNGWKDILEWVEFEIKQSNYGSCEEPKTAFWILCEGVKEYPKSGQLYRKWIEVESKLHGVGDYDIKYSARWICNEAWKNASNSHEIWSTWSQLEYDAGNIGHPGDVLSAFGIIRHGAGTLPKAQQIWNRWINWEYQLRGTGDYDTENSALWLCKKAIEHCSSASAIWIAWSNIEKTRGNISLADSQYSAVSILREGSKCCPKDVPIWMALMQLEYQINGAGCYSESYSARWICKEAVNNNKKSAIGWRMWAGLEVAEGNIISGEEYSALSILKDAYAKCQDLSLFVYWAGLEYQLNGMGDYNNKYSTRWIYDMTYRRNPKNSEFWVKWSSLEQEAGNIGSEREPRSAIGILYRLSKISPDNSSLWTEWAKMEILHNNEHKAKSILEKGLRLVTNKSPIRIAMAFYQAARDRWDNCEPDGAIFLIERLLSESRDKHTLFAAYKLYDLFGDKKIGAAYLKEFSEAAGSEEDVNMEYFEKLLNAYSKPQQIETA